MLASPYSDRRTMMSSGRACWVAESESRAARGRSHPNAFDGLLGDCNIGFDYPFDLGRFERRHSTSSGEAQRWFDRGLVGATR